MNPRESTYVQKACAYITRYNRELLVFESSEHEGLQIPKGTIEADESPREAAFREIVEESGLSTVGPTAHLASDVWLRRRSPLKHYVRHFYHTTVHEPRDSFTHRVTDGGGEHGLEFEYRWIDLDRVGTYDFALDLDDYVHLLETATGSTPTAVAQPSDD